MKNRILEGSLGTEMLRFGTPLALGMGLQTTFNLVDAYILGRLEHSTASASLGAIGICDQLSAMGTILSYGLSIATGTMLSKKRGAGDQAAVRTIAWQSLLFILALSFVFAIVAVLGASTLMHDVVGAKGRVAEFGTSYLRTMVGGSFTIFLLLHLTTIQRALGSSKTPIVMLVVANVLNFVIAVLLVYGPGDAPAVFSWGPPIARLLGLPRMELMGAAWATIIARALVLVPLAVVLVRRFGLFQRPCWKRPDFGIIGEIWRLGWPTSVQLVVRIAAMLITHSIVARAYTTELDQSATTALGIVFRLETMALFVGLGWGSASQTFIGQNLGARHPARAAESGWWATAYNAVMMAVVALLYRAHGAEIVAFFDATPAVVQFGREYIAWVGPSYVALGIGIVLGSAIQGAGATKLTLAIDALVVLLVQVPASVVAVVALGQDPARLFQVVAATYVTYAVVYVAVYKRGTFFQGAIAQLDREDAASSRLPAAELGS
jgi:putative MATE family efflux protein